ncbi:MAG: hypothetical protein AMS22_01065 [Thiotrichales bacterium SG8_50]|nr:MAG: hypothetical protein AMS22_01065 [Thiotrichales bacterium SG8_50]
MQAPDTDNAQGLLFVYNADSGVFNTLTDIAHKIFSPETYACPLCELTHGYFQIRGEWKAFIESLSLPCEFLHRDEARRTYGLTDAELPAVYRKTNDGLRQCLGPVELKDCADLTELRNLILTYCCAPVESG